MDRRFDEVRSRFDVRFDEVDARLSSLPVMQAQIDANSVRIHDLELQNSAYAQDLRELRSTIVDLQQDLHRDLRRASARLCEAELIISGVPCSSSDALPALVQQVASALGVPLANDDVSATRFLIPRSKARRNVKDAPLPIIARLRSRELCLKLLSSKKSKGILRTSDLNPQPSCPPSAIHLNEALPTDVYKLLTATRTAAKARGYRYIWHSNGAVLIKLRDGAPTQRIRSLADLEALEAESPPASPTDTGHDTSARRGSSPSRSRGSPSTYHTRGSRGASRGPSRGTIAAAGNTASLPPTSHLQ